MLRVSENRYDSIVQARHAHAETTVSMVLTGALRERVGEREEIGRPLSIVVKPRDTEHANEFGDGVRVLQICVTEAAAADLEVWSKDTRFWRWQHAGPSVPYFVDLLRALRVSGGVSDPDILERAAYDALASIDAGQSRPCGAPPRWLTLIREAVDDSSRPPRVDALAAQADVHPVYLARQFRRWFGRSITEHVRRRRVQRVAAAIATAGTELSLIAYETGFADQPHMTRVFARETGATPAAFRALVNGKV
jgi:AraC family transcriptional regulator